MLRTVAVPEAHFTFSVAAASEAQKRLALVVVLGLFVIFILLLAPLSNIQTGRHDSFVPFYTMAMFVIDAITAVFLFAEFSIVRTRALLAISSGYLFKCTYRNPLDPNVSGRICAGQPSRRTPEHTIHPLFLACWFSDISDRVCLVKGCAP
jgi:hypothetical protein